MLCSQLACHNYPDSHWAVNQRVSAQEVLPPSVNRGKSPSSPHYSNIRPGLTISLSHKISLSTGFPDIFDYLLSVAPPLTHNCRVLIAGQKTHLFQQMFRWCRTRMLCLPSLVLPCNSDKHTNVNTYANERKRMHISQAQNPASDFI